MLVCQAAYVSGVVQGVGFRYLTRHYALKRMLTGYAKNLDDGRVEVVVCGESESVEQFIMWLKYQGPATAKITQVVTEPRGIKPFSGFTIC